MNDNELLNIVRIFARIIEVMPKDKSYTLIEARDNLNCAFIKYFKELENKEKDSSYQEIQEIKNLKILCLTCLILIQHLENH